MKSLVFVLSCLMLSFACSKEKTFDEREINLISPEKISGFDPINASARYSVNETGQVYEGLFEFMQLKTPNDIMPNFAKALTGGSTDGQTYRL